MGAMGMALAYPVLVKGNDFSPHLRRWKPDQEHGLPCPDLPGHPRGLRPGHARRPDPSLPRTDCLV